MATTKVKVEVKVDHLQEVRDIYKEKTKKAYKIVLRDKYGHIFRIPVDGLPNVVQGENLILSLAQDQSTIEEYVEEKSDKGAMENE